MALYVFLCWHTESYNILKSRLMISVFSSSIIFLLKCFFWWRCCCYWCCRCYVEIFFPRKLFICVMMGMCVKCLAFFSLPTNWWFLNQRGKNVKWIARGNSKITDFRKRNSSEVYLWETISVGLALVSGRAHISVIIFIFAITIHPKLYYLGVIVVKVQGLAL